MDNNAVIYYWNAYQIHISEGQILKNCPEQAPQPPHSY